MGEKQAYIRLARVLLVCAAIHFAVSSVFVACTTGYSTFSTTQKFLIFLVWLGTPVCVFAAPVCMYHPAFNEEGEMLQGRKVDEQPEVRTEQEFEFTVSE
jgi:hypothetical protein